MDNLIPKVPVTTLGTKSSSTLSVRPGYKTHMTCPKLNPPLPEFNLIHSTLLGGAIHSQGSILETSCAQPLTEISQDLFQLKLQTTLLKDNTNFQEKGMGVSEGYSLQRSDMVGVCLQRIKPTARCMKYIPLIKN